MGSRERIDMRLFMKAQVKALIKFWMMCRRMCRMFLTGLLMPLTRLGAALQSSPRNLQPLVDNVQAAGVTECGAQVERPVVSCARPGEVVLEVHLVRALHAGGGDELFPGRHTCHSFRNSGGPRVSAAG